MPLPNDEALLRTALEAGRMIAFDWDLTTDRVHRIGDTTHFLGVPPSALGDTGAAYFALVQEDDRPLLAAGIAALHAGSLDHVQEYRVIVGGRMRWVRDAARAELDADGRLVRLRGVAVDITESREAEARLALIAAVSDRISVSDDATELLYEVARILGEHFAVRRCLFTEIDVAGDRGVVRRDYCRGVESVAGTYRVSDYAESTRREMSAGRTVVNSDSRVDPRTAADYERTYAVNGERAYVSVPLLRDGRWVAGLWISDDVPRRWSEQDVAVLVSVAERAWTAVEKLRVNAALRESEARMLFVGERAEVGYWYWDIASDELHWSPVCNRLHGVSEGETMTYARYLATLHPDDRDGVDRAVRSALERGVAGDYDIEARVVLPDGTERWVLGKGSAMFDGGSPVRMAGIALDITRRKLLELEREELLARERRLRAEADQASEAKDHFLALLSHELRTPMTTILGWASFVRSGLAAPAIAQKAIEHIEQASRTQARLIDDLLDVSRIVTGKMHLEKQVLDLGGVVRGAMDAIEPAARAAGVALHVDPSTGPAFVLGDAMRLQQVVGNLLSNAVKFTPAGGSVHVTLAQSDDAVELRVRDTGVGIDPDFLPHVFERFRQGEDGPSRSFGGLGLGLSIVRHLAELHGAAVHAHSDGRGRGAEFSVRMPRAAIAGGQELTPARIPVQGPRNTFSLR